ncbi:MAG: hypothetical protein RBQ99_07890 [Trichlorobacter sp.]|nr:hypothetical protein [Trichlorobacter sp.]
MKTENLEWLVSNALHGDISGDNSNDLQVMIKAEQEFHALRARVAKLEETLQFILNECDWEPTHHENGGDERIGTAARRALEEK